MTPTTKSEMMQLPGPSGKVSEAGWGNVSKRSEYLNQDVK
jgi:hypothetical protein